MRLWRVSALGSSRRCRGISPRWRVLAMARIAPLGNSLHRRRGMRVTALAPAKSIASQSGELDMVICADFASRHRGKDGTMTSSMRDLQRTLSCVKSAVTGQPHAAHSFSMLNSKTRQLLNRSAATRTRPRPLHQPLRFEPHQRLRIGFLQEAPEPALEIALREPLRTAARRSASRSFAQFFHRILGPVRPPPIDGLCGFGPSGYWLFRSNPNSPSAGAAGVRA